MGQDLRIFLARHGETDGHTLPKYEGDPPLTELGRKQSMHLANALATQGVERLYSSALLRAKETALPLSEKLRLPVTQLPGLNEIAQGAYPGDSITGRSRPISEFAEWGGESATEFSQRVSLAFVEVVSEIESNRDSAALFLHDGVLNVIVDYIEGVEHDGTVRNLFFNGSVSVLKSRQGTMALEKVNDISHLPQSLLTPAKYRSVLSELRARAEFRPS